jgi:hypothetical protein
VLRPGREVQQTLIRLEFVSGFETIVAKLREMGAGKSTPEPTDGSELSIAVPKGPMEHW